MGKVLSYNEIRSRCSKLVVDWRDSPGDEKQDAQSFIRDLLMAFGVSDTKAAFYEKRVRRTSTGNQGYIDALVPGVVLIEMKSKGRDLLAAESQALDYIQFLEEAEVPEFVLTSDFTKFRLLNLSAPEGTDTLEFSLEELPDYAEALSFLGGYKSTDFGSFEQEEASIRAAKLMGQLYEALEGSGYSEHESSIFLVRTLFALYADDAGVWQKDLFKDFLEARTASDGTDLGSQLSMLFQVLNQPHEARLSKLDEHLDRFPYVNGGVFGEPLSIPAFDSRMRDQLLLACGFNWSAISPSIFGSLFQAVKSAEARRELGEHYTTETNIKKLINPLFLDELEAEFDKSKNEVVSLRRLRNRLANLRVMDPACGCGNFLVVTYKALRDLELKILVRLQFLGDKESVPSLFFGRDDLAVQLSHVFGIEIEEWPARIAQTALLLTEHQANKAMELALGKAPEILPIRPVEGITIGNALLMDWSQVLPPSKDVLIVGNPPFVGHQTKKANQVEDLKVVWGKDYDGYLDYVTGWFKKSSVYFSNVPGGRFAFVSTNSITQGQPVGALFGPLFLDGWRIRFAHQTFGWSSEAPGSANVHCVIVGFDKHEKSKPELYRYPTLMGKPARTFATHINGHLRDGPNLFLEKRSSPLSRDLPSVSFGTMAIDGGNLTVEEDAYDEFSRDLIARKYLRKFVGARELIQNQERWCLWLEDLSPDDLRNSELLRGRVEACREFRQSSTKGGDAFKFRETPHLFRPNTSRPTSNYICIPRVVSENRKFFTVGFFDGSVISSDAVFTAEDPNGYAFAIASSSMFISWLRLVGGRLKSDLRFSSTLVWNNFPLPEIEEAMRESISSAGRLIAEYRKQTNSSLADLYDPLLANPNLMKLHSNLDSLVDKAMGAAKGLQSNDDREVFLLELSSNMAKP